MKIIEFLKSTDSLTIQLLITAALVLLYAILNKVTSRLIKRYGKRREISTPRVVYTTKYFRFVLVVFILLLLGLTWDISFEGLSVYFLSFFTVAGIGLFAAWSILSNITAAILLFFYFPYRIGDRIRIVDGDNSIEGIVNDLNMFSIIIKNDEGQKVTYPNNLALQKAIILIND
ncbi:mechanosensitive ion channel domain-containing protein [Marinoscillum luteum]|uniref:Mechanosensitive ion channel domain-containing protein n=1 Tax=Marinoscillum luteum TaxID=861051 RepID=A0ABW7N605_9BACT